MKTNSIVRLEAKEALRGKWGTFAATIFLSLVAQIPITGIVSLFIPLNDGSALAQVANFLLNNLLFFGFIYGLYIMALAVTRRKPIQVNMLFSVFNKTYYWPLAALNLLNTIANYLLGAAAFLPVLVLTGTNIYLRMILGGTINIASLVTNEGLSIAAGFLIVVMILLFLVLSEIISGVFRIATWVRVDQPAISVADSVKLSWQLLRPALGQYVLLQLSFIGWYLLGIITFFVGIFWAMAYSYTANAVFYEMLKEKQKSKS